jgi:hypothetical protein
LPFYLCFFFALRAKKETQKEESTAANDHIWATDFTPLGEKEQTTRMEFYFLNE